MEAGQEGSRIGRVLVETADLERRVAELGAEISRDYEGKDLMLVGVLKGAVVFIADLMRHLTVPCEIDFMAVSSYGSQTDSSGSSASSRTWTPRSATATS